MPRTLDPSLIVIGAGSAIPGSVSAAAITSGDAGGGPLDAHITDPSGAHAASAISIQDLFERYLAGNVEGALGELAALVPPAPGGVGSSGPPWLGSATTGVPDWGILKLWDGALPALSTVNTPDEIYPYYYRAPLSVDGSGTDPVTDPTFNVVDGVYTGGGMGKAHAGFVTVVMDPGGGPPPAADGYPSWRIIPSTETQVVVSGVVSPADRGVLALVKWDAGVLSAPVPATSVADIENRCVAALLLGRGLSDGGGGCDGTPGGLFTVGSPTPYDFPGQAAGQYDLTEIQGGFTYTPGVFPPVPGPANPSAGQVRLLTDPTAVPVTFVPPTNVNGLPILGATATYARGGVGTDGNFFGYRLPYLKDYSSAGVGTYTASATGIPYTPRTPYDETHRYFTGRGPSLDPATAGSYAGFTTDYWAVQIARYRHRFSLAGAGAPLRHGSFALVHFRQEAYFEEYVRDGIVPTADKVYSVNLVDWSGAAQITNLDALTPSALEASPAYSVNTSEVSGDTSLDTPSLAGGDFYTLSIKPGAKTTEVSGVSYYIPRDPTLAPAHPLSYNLSITGISAKIQKVFADSYRSHDRFPTAGPFIADDRFQVLNQNPVFLSLSSFSYEGDENTAAPASTITLGVTGVENSLFPASLGQVRRQRLEFGYADLFFGATDPSIADNAEVSFTGYAINEGIRFEGDLNTPVFTENAKARFFVRRALNVDGVSGYPLPANPAGGLDLPEATLPKILYHSMQEFDIPGTYPTYGNPYAGLNTGVQNAAKDREERFLDEVYRYPVSWEPLATFAPADAAQLIGPGLPGGMGALAVPVRPLASPYDGYFNLGYHKLSLSTNPLVGGESQVAGLPERNAPYTDGLDSPFPSRGILIYPKDDYSGGYSPAGNPNYSVIVNDRAYIRAFDAGAANVGAQSVILKFWGIKLADFAYLGPTPGGLGIAILVKIPGLTTWMDIGRVDGAGPSKQDPLLDGAGCKVVGPNTFDVLDPANQIQCSQVEVNLGPMASLFLSGTECPVLVKVILNSSLDSKSLDWQTGTLPTASTSLCRGLVGIEVVTP